VTETEVGPPEDETNGDGPDDDEYEYEELRPEMSRGRKVLLAVIGVLAVLTVLVAGVAFWSHQQLFPNKSGDVVLVDVPTGSSTNSIIDLLNKKQVVDNAPLFKAYLRVKGGGPFQAGTYSFTTHENADKVLATLKGGPLPPPTRRFTVQPALNLRQVPARIVQDIPTLSIDEFNRILSSDTIRAQLQPAGQSLEGFLFPDTYELGEGADESAVVSAMVQQFDAVANEMGLANSQALVGYDPYEVLIVASLVEREAKVDADRAQVAQVIYNRLASGTPLGVDATLCYLKDEQPCVLRQSDLAQDTPYNTRLNTGLPPTPISNVSRASLEAALHPAAGNAIYYVLDPNVDPGGQRHLFTASASEFEAAKARCKAAGLGCD
jgi:UPF0755 protein